MQTYFTVLINSFFKWPKKTYNAFIQTFNYIFISTCSIFCYCIVKDCISIKNWIIYISIINITVKIWTDKKSQSWNLKRRNWVIFWLNTWLKSFPSRFIITQAQRIVYLIRVVYTTHVVKLCFIKWMMLRQILPVRTAPRFNASVTYFWRYASTFNNITISCNKNC